MLVLLLFLSAVAAFTRSSVDYDTIVGNCTEEKPVFGKPVDGGHIGCHGKFDFILELHPWQRINFFDVNYPQWFKFRHVTRALYFDGYLWLETKYRKFNGHILVVPITGQLLYARERHDRHVFFRSFGTFSTTAMPPSTVTRTVTLPTSSVTLPTRSPTVTRTVTLPTSSVTLPTIVTRTEMTSQPTGTTSTTSRSHNHYGYFGFLVLLLVPLGCVWKKRRRKILPFKIYTRRYFNPVYDGDMDPIMCREEVHPSRDEEIWDEIELNV